MKNTYIIGEIGQNHNGSVDLAKLIIELISRPVHEDVFGMDFMPMNAVKMTKRDLSEELPRLPVVQRQRRRGQGREHDVGRTLLQQQYDRRFARLRLQDGRRADGRDGRRRQ